MSGRDSSTMYSWRSRLSLHLQNQSQLQVCVYISCASGLHVTDTMDTWNTLVECTKKAANCTANYSCVYAVYICTCICLVSWSFLHVMCVLVSLMFLLVKCHVPKVNFWQFSVFCIDICTCMIMKYRWDNELKFSSHQLKVTIGRECSPY